MQAHVKTIIHNTLAQLVAKFVGAGLTLITTVLIIRLSGPALFGDLTKALVLIAVGFTAIDFGLNAIVVRNLGKATNNKALMAEVLGTRLVLSIFAVLVINLLVFALPGGYTPAIKSIFWLGSLAIIFQGLTTSMNAWFQYQENYWSSTWAVISGALVSAGLTYYYVGVDPSLAHFLLANTLGYLVMAIVSLCLGREVVGLTLRPEKIYRLLKNSLILGGILLASIAASKLDAIILGVARSSAEVGEYGFAYRIFDVILVLPVFIMNAIYPKLIKESARTAQKLVRSSLLVLGIFGIIVGISAWLAAPWILFIRPGLTLAVTSLRLLVLSLPLFFLTAPLMWQQISLHREKTVLGIYLAAACLNGLCNLFLIPSYGAPAAALVTGVTELYIFIALLYFSRKPTAL